MKHKSRKKTLPHYFRAVPYNRTGEKQEERKEIDENLNEEPDLEFITEGTKKITEGEGILAQFCPHIEYCPRTDIDLNCFMEKFFHCYKARELEKEHPLSKLYQFYLKNKDLILKGEFPFQLQGSQ